LATNQIDFDVPAKMGLTYTDTDGSEKTPLCIHRAPLGTHERFIGFLIEHFAGLFPLWLAPVQLAILPVASVHEKYADQVAEMCKERGLRFQVLDPSESLGKRIREGEKQRIPYLLVLGDKEIADKSVAVRNVKTKEQVSLSLDEFLEKTVEDVACRKLGYSIG
jgi:threonyl-tRNA synthetase